VGISFLGEDKACANLHAEIPTWSLEAVRAAAAARWNDALRRIQIEGATDEDKRIFYTALYHCHLMPTDRTGENPKWRSAEPSYDDYYAIWDTFRTLHPLLTLIQPERQRDMVRSMIDIFRHDGYLPDGRSGNDNGRTQGGSNGDVVLADAYVKGLTGIDYETAYRAMLKDAEVEPPDPVKEGRGGLADYLHKGYVSMAHERSASRTVEYANDDWAIAQVARGLGRTADFERLKRRAEGWKNLWDPTLEASGVRGFIRPREADGRWHTPFSVFDEGSWHGFFYESTAWEYSLYAPQDVRALIALSGGAEPFLRRLDVLFDGGHFHIDNEPAFFCPYLYLWIGRADRAADRLRETLASRFHAGPDGLPGNDDSGATSAWYLWGALGLYPNAGQDVYLIGSPIFPRATLLLEHGKRIVLEAKRTSPTARYVRSLTVNGKPWDRAWLRHADLKDGATLVFEMGDQPSAWPSGTPPPSMSD
jgi:predicted alpha-1,2-mannosidase